MIANLGTEGKESGISIVILCCFLFDFILYFLNKNIGPCVLGNASYKLLLLFDIVALQLIALPDLMKSTVCLSFTQSPFVKLEFGIIWIRWL